MEESEPEEPAIDANDDNLIIEYDWVENNLPDLQLNIAGQVWIDFGLLLRMCMFTALKPCSSKPFRRTGFKQCYSLLGHCSNPRLKK